jgi:putative protease
VGRYPAKVEAAFAGGADWIIYGGDIFTGKDVTYTNFTKALALARKAGRQDCFFYAPYYQG